MARTNEAIDEEDVARFTEAAIGVAYRPVMNNRLNVITKAVLLSDLPGAEQRPLRTDQRSMIASMDVSYEIGRKWQVGGKVAVRESEIRPVRSSGLWIGNDAKLATIQVRYHLLSAWDGLAEYRVLWSDESQDKRHGIVTGLYRQLGSAFSLGVGYNFTGFSDDLRGLEADTHGWFVNAVGKF